MAQEYLFYTLGCNPLLFYLFCCSHCSTFGLWELFQLSPVYLWHTFFKFFFFIICFWSFLYFLALKDAPSSSCIFLYPSLRISHFSKELWFLSLDNGIRNLDVDPRCALCYWSVFAPKPSQLTRICTHVYRHVYKYFHM